MPARGWQAGQPQIDQQNPSKWAWMPANILNRDRQHPLGTRNREPVAPI